VKWALDLPGPAGATPIVLGDRVFISTVDVDKQQLVAMCLDRKTGKILWQHNAGSGHRSYGEGSPIALEGDRPGRGPYSNYASPSPVTDGKVVIFFYGNGDLVGYSLEGKRLWARNVQKDHGDFAFQWTFGAGPTLYEGRLYLPVLQRDQPAHRSRGRQGAESFLLAYDPATGRELWRHVRPSNAQMESLEAYTSAIPYEFGGRKQLLIAGGDYLTSHDPQTGQELWRWGTWNPDHREQWWRLVPSPVAGDGVVIACAPKRAPIYAVSVPESENDKARLLWDSSGNASVASDVPTPAFAGGSFFVLNDQKPVGLSRVEAKTGKVLWSTELPARYLYRASPTIADGKVFCMNYRGDVVIADVKTGQLLAEIAMGQEDDQYTPSTIAVAHNQLFIRTQSRLYCIGK
jgi:outer membrane protein assembly factor BamB